jgi:hypothetical protein
MSNTPMGATSDIFGEVEVPEAIAKFNADSTGEIGLLFFISRLVQLAFVGAGLFVLYNVISAGFIYLSSEGDSKAHEKVKNQITYSILGLIIIVTSFGFMSLIGLLLFGDADFFLNPQL